MSCITVTIKNLAKETDTLIIALAQLNREGLTTPDKSKLAESIGLARDSDFLFTVFKPFNLGLKGTATKDNNYNYTENSFVLKLDSSRHTASGKNILLELESSGILKEITSNYAHINIPESYSKPVLSYYEPKPF
jgi:hypothetical protein